MQYYSVLMVLMGALRCSAPCMAALPGAKLAKPHEPMPPLLAFRSAAVL